MVTDLPIAKASVTPIAKASVTPCIFILLQTRQCIAKGGFSAEVERA